MIDFSAVAAVAAAEARVTRRLVRFWIFTVLSALVFVTNYAQFHAIHYFFSGWSASAASTNPRYFFNGFALNFMLVYGLWFVFLGFDVRARDQRERMAEVLDSRPCSNVELLLGKLAGLFAVTWVPCLLLSALLWVGGWWMGNPPEAWSMLAFLALMAPPAFVALIGLVYLVALLVRHRLLAALAALAVIGTAFWVTLWWVPLYAYPAVDLSGGLTLPYPSDMVPRLVDARGLIQRVAYLLVGGGLLWIAAAVHPRRDDGSRARRAAAGGALLLCAGVLLGFVVRQGRAELTRRERWAAAHQARAAETIPDLRRVAGTVRLDPGRSLALDLTLTLRAPESAGLERALFTLNPGLAVREVGSPAGPLQFTWQDGLLDVVLARPLAAGEEAELRLSAAGRPDRSFGFLRGAFDPRALTPGQAQVVVLGFENIVFDRRLAVLLPGSRWLPASGSEGARTESDGRARDLFQLDLTVDVPAGWLAAGPGRRREAEAAAEAGRARFRFDPGGFLPEAGLVAGRFSSYRADIDGVAFEALLHPAHRKNVEFFADAGSEIRRWLEERLVEARRVGLTYPYDGLTLVEVPGELRGYSAGWRMDTTLAQPGLILMREASFPTARFDAQSSRRLERAQDQEGGLPRAKLRMLEQFFENDLNGGNPFIAAARSFFGYQTAGIDAAAVPLDYALEGLASRVLVGRQGYFSVHFFRDRNFGQTFAIAGGAMNDEDRVGQSYSEVLEHMVTSTPAVWNAVLESSLARMDPWEDPKRTVNALALKGGAMARSLLDALGRDQAGRLLAALRARTAGVGFTRDDLVAAGDEAGVDLRQWLEVWIDGTGLAGFVLGPVTYQRLTDAADGAARYQTLVTLRNGEPAPGVVRLEYLLEGERQQRASSEPATVPAGASIELGLVTSAPLRDVRVYPYFALNRDPFAVPLPELDAERLVPGEPFSGARPSDWVEPAGEAIVVDDLDAGFSIEEGAKGLMRVTGRGGDKELDQGLPLSDPQLRPRSWSRAARPAAWGRYRRTLAVVRPGDGRQRAVFSAELPRAGRWEVEYFVPRGAWHKDSRLGRWKLELDDGRAPRELSLDAAAATGGWNSLGIFELGAGPVKLAVPNAADGSYLGADAVRFTPAGGAEVASR